MVMRWRVFFLGSSLITGIAVILTDLLIGETGKEELFIKIITTIIISCLAFYIPVLVKIIQKSGDGFKKRKELRFLKKIFVMCGSVKPVDYMQVVNSMYERADFYKKDLENIMDVLRKSNVDKEDFFYELLSSTEDIDSKLFYEKLCIGFLYDFDLAIKSIEGDFLQEKRAYARFIKKRVNLIHIVGVTGLFVAMTILLMYMLKPWLNSMSFQQF